MFQVQASITKVSTFADHSLRLQVDTSRELSPEENALVFSLYNKSGWFLFKEAEIQVEDIEVPEYVKEFKVEKSASEILRNRLYVYYTKKLDKKEGFEVWRKNEMDRIGLHYLNQVKDK